jgi:hypothetical protein
MFGKGKISFKPSMTAFVIFSTLFISAITYVFWGTWSTDVAFVQPDNGTIHPASWVSQKWLDGITGGMLTPGEICQFVGGAYVWQELQYALAAFASALGVAYYLKGKRLSPAACYGAGLFYGFAGYSLSLFSAGHLGWFVWLTYGPFAFGLTDRVVRKGKWSSWLFLGAVLAWASARQPDMWLLFTVFTFFYGIWCLVREKGGMMFRKPVKFFSGLIVCAVVMFSIGWPQFSHAIFHDLQSRDKQIEDSAPGVSDTSQANDSKRWQFVTGWSMPPEDTLEFVAPLVRGCSSDPRVSPDIPYWGRLGRAPDDVFVAGRMMPNYRQHSLYLGAVTCAFALLAIFSFLFKRKDENNGQENKFDSADVSFWALSAVILLFCAFGRFTPFYKLIYKLPFGDYLRAPVKFHHLFELCTAMLAGFGIQSVLNGFSSKRFKIGIYVTMGLGLTVLLCGVATDGNMLASSISKLGYAPQIAHKAASNFTISCIRGAIMLVGVAFVAVKAWKLPCKTRLLSVGVLIVVGVMDLTLVNKKYTAVQSLKFQKAENAAASDIAKDGGTSVYVALLPQEGYQFISESFWVRDIKSVEMKNNPEYVFAAESSFRRDNNLMQMRKDGLLETLGAYTVTEAGILSTRSRPNTFLFKVKNASKFKEEKKPISPLSILSLVTTLGVLALGGFTLCKNRRG